MRCSPPSMGLSRSSRLCRVYGADSLDLWKIKSCGASFDFRFSRRYCLRIRRLGILNICSYCYL